MKGDESQELGRRLQEFNQHAANYLIGAIVAGALMLAAGGLAVVSPSFRYLTIGGALLCGCGVILFTLASMNVRKATITFFEKGLCHQVGPNSVAIRWSEIRDIEVTYISTEMTCSFAIELRTAESSLSLSLEQFYYPALQEMLTIIHEHVGKSWLSSYVADLEDGKHVELGPFEVSRKGIEWEDGKYSWKEIDGFRVVPDGSEFARTEILLALVKGERIRTGVMREDLKEYGVLVALAKKYGVTIALTAPDAQNDFDFS